MPRKKEKPPLSKDREEQKKIWREELEGQDYFKQLTKAYNAGTVVSWLDHYMENKYTWLDKLARNEEHYEDEQLRWVSTATDHLGYILQKKLFDVQCLWRAEQVKDLPGVEICYDFQVWEKNVFNCPFIEPITIGDVDLYISYLQHPGAEPDYWPSLGGLFSWQNYDAIQEAEREQEPLPPWYEYHNQFTTAGGLLTLPDTRGMKEAGYFKLYYQSRREELEAAAVAANTPRDERPILFSTDEEFLEKILAREEPQVRRARKLYNWRSRFKDDEESVLDMTRELLRAEEPVPVDAHDSWLGALKEAYRSYECKMIVAAFPHALEEYRMNVQMNIGFSWTDVTREQSYREGWMEMLLTGRRVAGEPENTDF